MRYLILAAIAVLAVSQLDCTPERKSASGFWLPDGDPESGKAVFVELKCHTCHAVRGFDEFPRPVADPPVPVSLGGTVGFPPTDGELMTSIVNPSHKISTRYYKHLAMSGSGSRMGDFTEAMTVKQMIDLVAFLHTTYRVEVVQNLR